MRLAAGSRISAQHKAAQDTILCGVSPDSWIAHPIHCASMQFPECIGLLCNIFVLWQAIWRRFFPGSYVVYQIKWPFEYAKGGGIDVLYSRFLFVPDCQVILYGALICRHFADVYDLLPGPKNGNDHEVIKLVFVTTSQIIFISFCTTITWGIFINAPMINVK